MASRVDSGSNGGIFSHNTKASVPRSLFDLSYLHTFTADIGALIPFYLQEVVPGDELTLSNDILARAMPMVVPPMARMKIITNYVLLYNNEMWHQWNPFVTKGRRGNYDAEVPRIDPRKFADQCGAGSVWNSMGFPILSKDDVNKLDTSLFPSAFPFYAYQRYYRDYECNKNLNQNNKGLFPDNDYDWVLKSGLVSDVNVTGDDGDSVPLWKMHYADFRDDYFTTGLPWPVRGDVETLDIKFTGGDDQTLFVDNLPENLPISLGDKTIAEIAASGVNIQATSAGLDTQTPYLGGSMAAGGSTGSINVNMRAVNAINRSTSGSPTYDAPVYARLKAYNDNATDKMSVKLSLAGMDVKSSITCDELRRLFAVQIWQERNARTDGDYNSMIKAHYGVDPHINDGTPIYIGGTVQDVVFTEVLSSAQTETGSSSDARLTPVGAMKGHGITSASGYVGKVHAKDFGLVLGVMKIVPDVTYSQGIPREWSRTTYDEYYWPEFNELGPQAILNKELFVTGNADKDNDIYAYQERFAEMRHRRNMVSGLLAKKDDEYFSSWTWARFFSETPTLSNSFVNMEGNVRKNMFAVPSEPPFVVQVANRCRAVRRLPYKSIPAGL